MSYFNNSSYNNSHMLNSYQQYPFNNQVSRNPNDSEGANIIQPGPSQASFQLPGNNASSISSGAIKKQGKSSNRNKSYHSNNKQEWNKNFKYKQHVEKQQPVAESSFIGNRLNNTSSDYSRTSNYNGQFYNNYPNGYTEKNQYNSQQIYDASQNKNSRSAETNYRYYDRNDSRSHNNVNYQDFYRSKNHQNYQGDYQYGYGNKQNGLNFQKFSDNVGHNVQEHRNDHNRVGKYKYNGPKINNIKQKEHQWKNGSSLNGNTRKKTESGFMSKQKMDAASQRERLADMITRRTLECLVCCEIFKHHDKIWSCKQCYHIFHLKCTKEWATSSKLENGWRCPACQNVSKDIPSQYRCFCGKMSEPRMEPGLLPHSCGDVCSRKGRFCDHGCTILCHAGPCPECVVLVNKNCGCGATTQQVKCSADIDIVCQADCDKLLSCGIHRCRNKCHAGSCGSCDNSLRQECFCGKVGRKIPCSAEENGRTRYSCESICDKLLLCGNHRCQNVCHEGSCPPCEKDVSLITTCPCGKNKLSVERKSCLDPVECCEQLCRKRLRCGQPNSPHLCKSKCHDGECLPCDLTTMVKCRCGHMDKEVPCVKLTTKADDARCEKKCTKKRLCGKHRCNQRCCIEIEHVCPLPCNHSLTCGKHRCENTCHSGRCLPCTETSFDELSCECGASILFPPIHCGTKPPPCNKPCTRDRPCGHEVNHACHTGPCPSCTVLSKRWCYGRHEQRAAIPCHQENFSCGLACGKPLPCKRHKCTNICHLGRCPEPCKLPCTIERPLCGHPCNAPCHGPPCPETSCKSRMQVTCQCGLQKATRPCNDLIEEFRSLEASLINEKMASLSKEQTFDISDLAKPKKPSVLKILECTEECKVIERNRRLAIGLQIRNPDMSQKLTPKYSEFMRGWAKKDLRFCQRVHDKLTELVQLAKQSKQKSRSYSFESMNRDKRHFIHEYCEHFGCESAAYDMEPNRNIVATATRDKSWLPGMSLMEVIQRENGQRKVPGPAVLGKTTPSKSESVSLNKLPSRTHKLSNSTPSSFTDNEPVDYFNNPPVNF